MILVPLNQVYDIPAYATDQFIHCMAVKTVLVFGRTIRNCMRILKILVAMMRQEGVTEALKADDQMEWVRRRNSIHSRAEEIVLHEFVYAE